MTARTEGPGKRDASHAPPEDAPPEDVPPSDVPPSQVQPPDPGQQTADQRVVTRALTAGAGTIAVTTLLSLAVAVLTGGDGVVAAVWATSGVVLGALVASGWLVLSLGLDMVAGVVPGRRRVIWTVAVFAVAFISPILPAAMLQVAAAP